MVYSGQVLRMARLRMMGPDPRFYDLGHDTKKACFETFERWEPVSFAINRATTNEYRAGCDLA